MTDPDKRITRRNFLEVLLASAAAVPLAGCDQNAASVTDKESARKTMLTALGIKGPALVYILSDLCVSRETSPHDLEGLKKIAALAKEKNIPLYMLNVSQIPSFPSMPDNSTSAASAKAGSSEGNSVNTDFVEALNHIGTLYRDKEPYPGIPIFVGKLNFRARNISDPLAMILTEEDVVNNARTLGFETPDIFSLSGKIMLVDSKLEIKTEVSSLDHATATESLKTSIAQLNPQKVWSR